MLAPGDLVAKSPADGGLPPYELVELSGGRCARCAVVTSRLALVGGVVAPAISPPDAVTRPSRRVPPLPWRLVVFDFDGVFSDNRVWTNDRGEESVACFRGDSAGLRRLDEVGVDYFILTRDERRRAGRARKIRIECVRGIEDKLPVLREEVERRGVSPRGDAYVGNDINDAECLASVGLPVVRRIPWAE